jgi:TPR repeat protein
VPKGDAEAVKWYQLAAKQGDATALHNLGPMYFNGQVVPQVCAEALKLYLWQQWQASNQVRFVMILFPAMVNSGVYGVRSMEKCILFVCWTILTESDFKPADAALWQGS